MYLFYSLEMKEKLQCFITNLMQWLITDNNKVNNVDIKLINKANIKIF